MNVSKLALLSLVLVLSSAMPLPGAQPPLLVKPYIQSNLTFNMSLNGTLPVQTYVVPFSFLGNASLVGNGVTVLASMGWPTYTNQSGGQSQLLGDQMITAFHPFYGRIPFYGNLTITVLRFVKSGVYRIPINTIGAVSINTTLVLTLNNPNNVNGTVLPGNPVYSSYGGVATTLAPVPSGSANSVFYAESITIVALAAIVVALLRARRHAAL